MSFFFAGGQARRGSGIAPPFPRRMSRESDDDGSARHVDVEDQLRLALQGRNPYHEYAYACRYAPVPENLGAEPAFVPSYPPYPYQRQAAQLMDDVYLRDARSNVLVASPTGSGKSFAIHWAAKRALELGYRLIIGVPLVALAEQIYSQLRHLLRDVEVSSEDESDFFEDDDFDLDASLGGWSSCPTSRAMADDDAERSPVGIRTGPSEKHPDAPVLVCTYEVVLLLLHHDVAALDRVPLVVLDEVHTIADPERGHVVETLLTQMGVPVVGMSGTLPNTLELAEYMGRCNRLPTRVIGATSRPIALRYHLNLPSDPPRLHTVRVGEAWQEDVWKRSIAEAELALPEQISMRARHQLVLRLVRHMEHQELLPAMCVAFSCQGLDATARALHTIDLLPSKRTKALVHVAFHRIRRALEHDGCPEEWALFEPLLELATRGIGVHHAQNPKLYLEVLPDLVRKGRVRLILATSTLSAGIDLPVRTTAFIGGLRVPSKKGFRCIEPNLFHQICGRAGRPGQETEGHVIIGHWTHEADVQRLLTSRPRPVRSQYQLTPSLVLRVLARPSLSMEDVLRSSFASDDVSYVPTLLRDVDREVAELLAALGQPAMARAMRLLQEARALVPQCPAPPNRWMPGTRLRLDPDEGALLPPLATVKACTKRGTLVTHEYGETPRNWVFAEEPPVTRKTRTLVEADAQRRLHACLADLTDVARALAPSEAQWEQLQRLARLDHGRHEVAQLARIEHLWIWPSYQRLLERLRAHQFVTDDDDVLTHPGRLAAGLVAVADPLTLVMAWTSGILPRDDPVTFVTALTPFLAQWRARQPTWTTSGDDDDGDGARYVRLCALQHTIWEGEEAKLGSWMLAPMRQWMQGTSVHAIVTHSDVAVGHVCKEIQRTHELLRQLDDAARAAGDDDLAHTCAAAQERLARGLPFVQSLHLRS